MHSKPQFYRPAHERIGVVDTQWIRHKVIPSLGAQGESQDGKAGWEGVQIRCKYEWKLYTERWQDADQKLKLATNSNP